MLYISFLEGQPTLLLAVFIVLAYIVTGIVTWYRLRHVPGPILASFSYMWTTKTIISGRTSSTYRQLHDRYGPLVRVGPRYVVSSDPNAMRKISSTYNRDSWYTGGKFDPAYDHIGTILNPSTHHELKKRLAPVYSGRGGIDLDRAVDSQVDRLRRLVRQHYLSTADNVKPVDFAMLSRFFTVEVIATLAYGAPFGFLDAGQDLFDYFKLLDQSTVVLSLNLDVPVIRRAIHSSILAPFSPKVTDKTGLGKLIGLAQEAVRRRFEAKDKEPSDMATAFLQRGISLQQTEGETVIQLIAGTDTTAIAMISVVLHATSTPKVYRRLKEELSQAKSQGRISHPVTLHEAKSLPYLQAVICEALRMRPPVIYGFYKVVPPQGDVISGKFVPGGTAVGHNWIGMMRSVEVFGPDVDVFRPERFLECDEASRAKRERVVDLAFGAGQWMCAGKVIALTELNKVIVELFREFDLQIIHPGNAIKEVSHVFYGFKELWLKVTEAEH